MGISATTAALDIVDTRAVDSGQFVDWLPLSLQPQLIAIAIATLFIVVCAIYFYVKCKNTKPNESLTGLALMIELMVNWVRTLVADVLGVKFVKLTPYFLCLFFYISVTNLTSIIGFEPSATSYTVPLTMGLVTFIGIFVVGVKYQRLSFFKRYLLIVRVKKKTVFAIPNPLEILGQFTPLISITFRLWGNITAGGIILTLVYGLTAYVVGYIPIIGAFNFLGSVIAPFLHVFFDLFEGILQAFIFTLLTLTYWSGAANSEEHEAVQEIEKEKQAQAEQPAVLAAKPAMVT